MAGRNGKRAFRVAVGCWFRLRIHRCDLGISEAFAGRLSGVAAGRVWGLDGMKQRGLHFPRRWFRLTCGSQECSAESQPGRNRPLGSSTATLTIDESASLRFLRGLLFPIFEQKQTKWNHIAFPFETSSDLSARWAVRVFDRYWKSRNAENAKAAERRRDQASSLCSTASVLAAF